MLEIKKCPICGREPTIHAREEQAGWNQLNWTGYAYCNCGFLSFIRVEDYSGDKESVKRDAAKKWNTFVEVTEHILKEKGISVPLLSENTRKALSLVGAIHKQVINGDEEETE